jgi:hypothetical protein
MLKSTQTVETEKTPRAERFVEGAAVAGAFEGEDVGVVDEPSQALKGRVGDDEQAGKPAASADENEHDVRGLWVEREAVHLDTATVPIGRRRRRCQVCVRRVETVY